MGPSVALRLNVLCILLLVSGGCERQDMPEFKDRASDTNSTTSSSGYEVIDVPNGGTISGNVTLVGDAPKLDEFEITSDGTVCSAAADNNRLELGPNGGVRYAVVYLDEIRQGKPMPARAGESFTMDQTGCQYVPHVIATPVGSTVKFLNSDPIPHNVRVEDAGTDRILLNRAQGAQGLRDSMQVTQKGLLRVGCDYHPWMNAYVFGVDNPYYAVTDADGAFTIDRVPPGNYTVKLWFNGIRTIPRRDNQGKLVRYEYSEPAAQQKSVEVKAGASSEIRFEITENVK